MTHPPSEDSIFSLAVGDDPAFDELALQVWEYQAQNIPAYREYQDQIGANRAYIPVDIFKLAGADKTSAGKGFELHFASSATGGIRAHHFVNKGSVYRRSVLTNFALHFGSARRRLLFYLPSYADNPQSSLVQMVDYLVDAYGDSGSGLFLESRSLLDEAIKHGTPVFILGAAFGLVDFSPQVRLPGGSVVVETGGMKTHRRAIGRVELHQSIAENFGISEHSVYSEYGMCEMLSQAWAMEDSLFRFPPWVRWSVVSLSDPEVEVDEGETGLLRVTDLANLHSISFLLLGDKARQEGDGFYVDGRWDPADLRGCNFLLEPNL